jgi:molybdopterin-containing oxidoreductase family membrane subunit
MIRSARRSRQPDEVLELPVRFEHRLAWWLLFLPSLGLFGWFLIAMIVLFTNGTGIWGNNSPVFWGFPIINYVWWLGIGHAGSLISGMLLLTAQSWRNALNRFAEAMTVFAASCAGIWPIIHLGRPWRFYWMAPYVSTMGVWPQFKSPLSWDFFAVLVYITVSILFWYVGMIPDLALARDRVSKRRWRIFYGLLALGWRGSAKHWTRWRQSYRLLAAMAIPLVADVTASYTMLFSGGPIPGWNSTVWPPYFVAGAVFTGFAIISMLATTLRYFLDLQPLITDSVLDHIGMLLLTTGFITGYGYLADVFNALYAGGYELDTLTDRMSGYYAWSYWAAVALNFAPLQLMWWRRLRRSPIIR